MAEGIKLCGRDATSTACPPGVAVRAPISPFNMVFGEKTISGTYYGSVRPDIDFPILADLDMDKKLNLDDLISRT
jgi:S-(hydroxymethyl)glutathione dehydrogenase/alcohol dehydrogenase